MRPTDPIHPVAAALLAACLVVGIAVRVAFTHGLGVGFAALMVGGFAVVLVYGAAEMLTWAPDDPRWDDVAEAQLNERDRFRFP